MSNDLEKWLNKKESSRELITDSLIQKFEACLSADVDLSNLLGLHWCLAQPIESNINLSEDGHIKKGNFMPPIPLEQRMWASSSIKFYKNLSSLNEIKRVSEIKKIETKHLANHFFGLLFTIFSLRRKVRVIGIIGTDTNHQQFYQMRNWNIFLSVQLVVSSILLL